ncbi:hypothetical protein [Clostridium sp.]
MTNKSVFNNSPEDLKTQIYGSNISVPIGTDDEGALSAGINNVGPNVNSLLNKLQTTVNSSVVQLYPQYGISLLRDTITVVGAATVTTPTSGNGYQLLTTAVALNTATLDSAINSQHNMGTAAEGAIEVLLPVSPIGAQTARWGIFSDQDGFCFGQNSTGIFISTRLASVETLVYQSSWNGDKLNGTGPSGLSLNLAKGNQFQFTYMFAFGVVEFRVVMQDASNIQQVVTVHRYRLISSPNINDPNLPLRAEIKNGATATALSLFVYSRSYAVLGVPDYSQRVTSQRRIAVAVSTTFLPLVSFRKKVVFPAGTTRPNSVTVYIEGLDLLTDQECIWQIRLNSTLTGASFVTPLDTLAAETCLETDVSATAINTATGVLIYEGLAASANKATFLTSRAISLVVPDNLIITVAARIIGGAAATVTSVLRMRELW